MAYSSLTRALGVSTLGLLIYNPRALRVFGPGTMLVALGDAVTYLQRTGGSLLLKHMHTHTTTKLIVINDYAD